VVFIGSDFRDGAGEKPSAQAANSIILEAMHNQLGFD
jgi:hypothetical protein